MSTALAAALLREDLADAYRSLDQARADAAEVYRLAGYPLVFAMLAGMRRATDTRSAYLVHFACTGLEQATGLPAQLRELGTTLATAAAFVCELADDEDRATSLRTVEQCCEEVRDALTRAQAAQRAQAQVAA